MLPLLVDARLMSDEYFLAVWKDGIVGNASGLIERYLLNLDEFIALWRPDSPPLPQRIQITNLKIGIRDRKHRSLRRRPARRRSSPPFRIPRKLLLISKR